MNEQLFLLLGEVINSRKALEALERSTARYAGIAIQAADAGGLGAPPLQGNALRVYVTNLNELSAGGGQGIGGVIEGVFGGIGRFIGGAIGSFAGGAALTVLQPMQLVLVAGIVSDVKALAPEITKILAGANELQSRLTPPAPPKAPGESLNTVPATTKALDDPGGALLGAGKAEQWLAILRELTGVVNGLIIVVPLVISGFASFLLRLTDVQKAMVDLLSFAIENALMLRGLVLITLFDAVSVAARVAGAVLRVLASAVESVVGTLATAVSGGLSGALTALIPLSAALKATIDPLMTWLRDGLGAFLVDVGDTRVFRLVIHLVNQLPVLLPPLLTMLDKKPAEEDMKNLAQARHWQLPGALGQTGAKAREIAPFPFPAEKILKETEKGLKDAAAQTSGAFGHGIMTAAHQAARDLDASAASSRAAFAGDREFNRAYPEQLALLKGQSQDLLKAFAPAREAFAKDLANPDKQLQAMAGAFEGWLTGKGYQTLLGTLTQQFKTTGTAPDSLPGHVAGAAAADAPRATVEIGEIVIELAPPAPAGPTRAAQMVRTPPDPHEDAARGGLVLHGL